MFRKRRYFIVRKDIRALCYYASKEDLTLLGSISLDENTRISNLQGENTYVLSIETEDAAGTPSVVTYIR